MPEEVQGLLHSRHLQVPEGPPHAVLCVSATRSTSTTHLATSAQLIDTPSCCARRCKEEYSGERCQFITLPLEKPQEGYNRTTALAVVAVVLSSVCLIIIGLLLLLR